MQQESERIRHLQQKAAAKSSRHNRVRNSKDSRAAQAKQTVENKKKMDQVRALKERVKALSSRSSQGDKQATEELAAITGDRKGKGKRGKGKKKK